MAETTIEKDGIKITTPTFGWAFNPIIADCVNPNNVKINAVVGETSFIEGDYYTYTISNSTIISNGYYSNVDGNSVFVSDTNYISGRTPISVDKGLKLRYTGYIDKNVFFAIILADGSIQLVEVNGASTPITNLVLTLPSTAIAIRVTTKTLVPFELNVGTLDSTQVSSNLAVQVSKIGYNGKTQFDLSGLSSMLFNRDEFYKVQLTDTTLYKNMHISFSYTVGSSTTSIGSANIGVIWGGLQIGEEFTQNRTYRYFKGYPFTIPLYLDETLVVKINDVEYATLNAGKYNFNISDEGVLTTYNEYSRKIFTVVFDKTFQPQRILIGNGIKLNIDIVDCKLGNTYLRWINTRGEWNYWLFKKTSEVIGTESSDIEFEQSYTTVGYTNNHHDGTGQYIGKQGIKTLNLAALFLDSDQYDHVAGISVSPIIDLYDNGNWKRVKMSDVDLSKSNRVLQNIEIEIELPNIISQKL